MPFRNMLSRQLIKMVTFSTLSKAKKFEERTRHLALHRKLVSFCSNMNKHSRHLSTSSRCSCVIEEQNSQVITKDTLSKGYLYHLARSNSNDEKLSVDLSMKLLALIENQDLSSEEIENVARCFNVLIHGLSNSGANTSIIQHIFEQIRDNINPIVNESTYSCFVRHLSSKGLWEEGLNLIDDMKKNGIEPHARTYGPIICNALKNGNVTKAFEIWHEMKDIEKEIDHEVYSEMINSMKDLKVKHKLDYIVKIFYHFRKKYTCLEPLTVTAIEQFFEKNQRFYDVGFTSISKNGKCNFCGTHLETINLQHDEIFRLKDEIIKLCEYYVPAKIKAGKKRADNNDYDLVMNSVFGSSSRGNRQSQNNLASLEHYLNLTGPYDLILDVLNVGYHAHKGFNTVQVINVMKYFREQSAKMLMFCAGPLTSTLLTHKIRNREDEHLAKFLRTIKRHCGLFFVESSKVDDYYMLSTIAHHDMNIQILTSDRLRDHSCHFEGEERLNFRRWQRAHQIELRGFHSDGSPSLRSPKQHDIITQYNQGSWHFPVDGGKAWLCVHKKERRQNKTSKQ